MQKFLVWANPRIHVTTPQEFLEWAEQQPKSMLVQDVLERFAETRAASQQVTAVSCLRSFLDANGYERKLPRMVLDVPMQNFHRSYKKEEVLQLLSFLDNPLQKLYVLASKDSGLRANDVLSIQYHHLKPDLEAVKEYCHVYFEPAYYPPARKKKYAGITFVGPNTVKLLKELLANGEVGKQPEARVFPFGYMSITDALRLARKKAGLDKRLQPSHGLRKFFENALDNLQPPLDDVKKQELEGHTLGVRWNYRDQEVDQLRPLYERVYPHLDLSVEGQVELAVDEKMRSVLAEVNSLREENRHLRDIDARLTTLEAQLEARVVYKPQLWPATK